MDLFKMIDEAYDSLSTVKRCMLEKLLNYMSTYAVVYYDDVIGKTYDISIMETSEEVLSRHVDRKFEIRFRTRSVMESERIFQVLKALVDKLDDDHGLEAFDPRIVNNNNIMYRYTIEYSPELHKELLILNNLKRDAFQLYLEL